MIKEIRIDDDDQHMPREIVIKVIKINNFEKMSVVFYFRQREKNYLIYFWMNIK
jgi:hypothetical protein